MSEPKPNDQRDLTEEMAVGKPFPQSSRTRAALNLARTLRSQHGVISLPQLVRCGLTRAEIRGMLTRGELVRLHRGVYGDGRAAIEPAALLQAGLWATGRGSFLAAGTAAGNRRLRGVDVRRIEVAVPGVARRPRPGGIIIHTPRAAPERGDVTEYLGLPTASVPLLLIQMAPTASAGELRRIVDAAVRRRAVDLQHMPARLERCRRWPGIVTLREALDGYVPRSHGKSGFEDAVDAWLRADPRVPPYERNVHVDRWEFDFWFGGWRAALETDGGPYHSTVGDIERDRIKDAWCVTHGVKLLRLTDFRFEHDRAGAMLDLLAVLGIDPITGDRIDHAA